MQSPWAARLYADARARGKRNPHATRIVARAWIRVIWACWHNGIAYDPAVKVNGRKRHIAVDTAGLVLAVVVTAASVQDRDAARPLLWNLARACTRIRLAWADAGYAGKLTAWAATSLKITVEIVCKRDAHAFEVLPRRWVVERTLAWITTHRRCARDYERLPASHEAMVLWAMIALMTQRLATD
jgi:transposase